MAAPKPLTYDPIETARQQWVARGWEEAAEGMAAVTSVMRAQQIYLARVDDALQSFGLTFARYELLMVLMFSRQGAMPLNKIGARLQVHPTSVTNAVDRLEAQKLIRRVPHDTDRRTTLACLEPAGRELAERATKVLNREIFELPGLSSRDAQRLIGLLRKLRVHAGDFHGTRGSPDVTGR